jgi:putative acetyltransferase
MANRYQSDVAIRPERPDDRAAIVDVVTAAFQSPTQARLVEAIRASANYAPELSLVAEIHKRVVGHVRVSFVALHDHNTQHRLACLSPLAVAPDFQQRGIGSELVRDVTSRAEARGEPCVVLEGSPTFYGRLGFEHSAHHGIHFTLPSWAPPEAAQVLLLRSYAPSIRGQVIYPPAFGDVTED